MWWRQLSSEIMLLLNCVMASEIVITNNNYCFNSVYNTSLNYQHRHKATTILQSRIVYFEVVWHVEIVYKFREILWVGHICINIQNLNIPSYCNSPWVIYHISTNWVIESGPHQILFANNAHKIDYTHNGFN